MRRFSVVFTLIVLTFFTVLFLSTIMSVKNKSFEDNDQTRDVRRRISSHYFKQNLNQDDFGFTKDANCKTIHLAMICSGYNSTRNLITVIKSVLFYRSKPLHIHIIVDKISERTLQMLFWTWRIPDVSISFYKAEPLIPKISWIPNRHYSGVYGLLKLVLPDVIQEEKVLVFDTDITILTDISDLWDKFNLFNSSQSLGLVENQSNWYIKSTYNTNNPWPALNRGFNTGVILMHLDRLRKEKFASTWTNIAKQVLKEISETGLADQDVLNAVIKFHPAIVHQIDCSWNVQLSDRSLSASCFENRNKINIIHWNSPRKQDVQIKNIEEFRKLHNIFLELDGNLLRRKLLGCAKNVSLPTSNRYDLCYKFTRSANTSYRTHYFYLEYDYENSNPDIVLVTQTSADRILLLEELSKHWSGPISVALYLSDADVVNFLQFIRESDHLRTRRNIAYHIVYKEGDFYPINYLRNVAMEYATSSHVFHLDIDFLPQLGLHETLIKYINALGYSGTDKYALIVPAFETQRYRFKFPTTKDEVLKLLNRGIIYTFRYHVWSQGHAATNYNLWKNASEPYEIDWEPDFEPYVVVPKTTLKYDTRFVGFGWNKVSYVTHLTAMGYRFIVLPDVFIIHRPHSPSRDIGKFRVDVTYRRCLRKLKDQFIRELLERYGPNALMNFKNVQKVTM